ncbi:hypothetical protein DVH24_001459 [Malus domestica]|uniref:Uncharacterized protein n=1 Tax=Malus domestica TaxID=3750 RepID=A0A498K5I1_MALDO|nr:hypothetical protein DVH24_001459 [Malus domestica]
MPKNLGAFVVVRVFYTSSLALSTPMLCQLGSFLVGVVVGGTDLNSLFLGICRHGFEPPIVYLGPLVGFVFCFKF